MTTVDFASVKERVGIVDGLEKLGINGLKVRGGQLRGQCPLCNGEGDRKFIVTPAKGVFYSFCCKKGGDVITLASLIRGESLREAAAWLIGEDTAPKGRTAPQEQQSRNQPAALGMKLLDYLEPEHEAVMALGLNPAALRDLGGGYAAKGVARGSVLLPIRDSGGVLLGYWGVQELTYIPRDFELPRNVVPLQKKA